MADPWYQHPGYSMVDHQLDPLLEVIRGWVYEMSPPYDGTGEPEWERGRAAVGACRAGLDALLREMDEDRAERTRQAERARLLAAGIPDPLLVSCPSCHAYEEERCWTAGCARASRPHRGRVRAAEMLVRDAGMSAAFAPSTSGAVGA